jgi:hypothetical protein
MEKRETAEEILAKNTKPTATKFFPGEPDVKQDDEEEDD